MTVHELKSLLTERTLWILLSKSAVTALTLLLIRGSGFHPLSIVAGLMVLTVIYFREPEEKKLLTSSFFLLPILFLLTVGFGDPKSTWAFAGLVLLFSVLFFILLGLANLFFRDRFLVYGVLNIATIVSFLTLFFYLARGPENFWVLGITLFIVTYLLLRENFVFFGLSAYRRSMLYAGTLSFIGLEFFYILQFLPLGFINAAVFSALFLALSKDLVVSSSRGNLDFSFMMRQITVFAVLTIVVFAASGW